MKKTKKQLEKELRAIRKLLIHYHNIYGVYNLEDMKSHPEVYTNIKLLKEIILNLE